MKLFLTSKITSQLKKHEIKSICFLKETHWKHGIFSQLKWYNENVKKKDVNVILKFSDKIIGYTLLRKIKGEINGKIRNYFLFDTLIIDKSFREKKFSKIMMKLNNKIIKKNKIPSFLICKKKMIKFYKLYNWKVLDKKKFKIKEIKSKKNLMSYNF